jgi:asparagine synthase (glutamine-hydrolysing)
MCGIAGIVAAEPQQAESAIRKMVPSMVHRGPDDSGYEFRPTRLDREPATLALGFRRLAILDLSPAGHQPMVHPETGDCLVFNGEIYNFRDLRAELEAAGCRFTSSSDTEVLLHALGRWGERALERLEGMYALAFYRAADRTVLLARDPLGIKPLYVAEESGRFLFASEIRTLLASGLVSRDLDAGGIAGMLAFGAVQAPRTVFKRIREFPAGHFQWLGAEPRRFWDFPEPTAGADADAPDMVRELVRQSVRRHLVADVPVGIFLSAGIDSTIIAACAAEAGANVTAFTVGIGDRYPDDEATVATATARQLGIPHRVVPIESGSLSRLWHQWIDSLDSPSIDGFNTFLVTKALADQGIKVGLSGLGADELFGGYPVFKTAPKLARLLAATRYLPRGLLAPVLESALRWAGRPGPAEKLAAVLAGRPDVAAVVTGLRRIATDRRLAAMDLPGIPAEPALPRTLDAFNVISRTEITHYMKNTLLRDSDANSMSHSLELRVPFLDLPLVNAVSVLPGSAKEAVSGPGKRLLRQAFAGSIPAAVTQRPKTGFTLPIGEWMRGEMREFCTAAIAACASIPKVDNRGPIHIWRHYLRHPGPSSWSQAFSFVALGSYLRTHAPTSS